MKRTSTHLKLFAAILFLTVIGQHSQALADFSSMHYNGVMSRVLHRQRMKAIYGDDVYRKHNPTGYDSKSPPQSTPSSNKPQPVQIQSLIYQPNPTVTQAGRAVFIKRMKNLLSPQMAQNIEQQMQQYDMLSVYQMTVQPYALESNNPAHTLAAYKVLAWMIANNHTQDPPLGSVQAVSKKTEQVLKKTPMMATASNRQMLDEELKYNFVVFHSGYASGLKEGGKGLPQLSDAIHQMWKQQFGQDLRQLQLTSQGFSKK